MTNEEALKGFLAEYKALCQRYGLCVDACGCCGSPYLQGAAGHLEGRIEHLETQGLPSDYLAPAEPPVADTGPACRDYPDARVYPFQIHLACKTRDEFRRKLPVLCLVHAEGCPCE
jgi:hypothetical protein